MESLARRQHRECRKFLRRREHRHRRAAVARLEHELDRLSDAHRIEVAVDDVGHHRRALGQGDIGDAIRHRCPPHHAVGVDRAAARGFLPFGLVAEAERTVGARIEMRLAAGTAFFVEELALPGGVPELLGFGVDRRRRDLALFRVRHRLYSLSKITVDEPCRVPSDPLVPCASAGSQFLT